MRKKMLVVVLCVFLLAAVSIPVFATELPPSVVDEMVDFTVNKYNLNPDDYNVVSCTSASDEVVCLFPKSNLIVAIPNSGGYHNLASRVTLGGSNQMFYYCNYCNGNYSAEYRNTWQPAVSISSSTANILGSNGSVFFQTLPMIQRILEPAGMTILQKIQQAAIVILPVAVGLLALLTLCVILPKALRRFLR